jgi:NADPH-dependent 2,4-dienoyl-CoA reductase/sulfur reductase-like enzyme
MARAFIADPDLANKAREGKLEDVRRCIANNECHVPGRPVVCAINAAAGKEDELRLEPAAVRRRVLVVGGGPAGLEAARVAALRGHQVVLCEQEAELGGQLAALARDANRRELGAFVDYQVRQLERLGVDLRLSAEVTPATVAALEPDAVVVATGSTPYVPPVPGITDPRVLTSLQVLRGEGQVGATVLVVGDLEYHLPPLTIADFLARQGKRVEIISAGLTVGQGVEPSTLHLLTKRLLEQDVTLSPHTVLKSLQAGQVTVTDTFTRRERVVDGVDTIVLACGGRANTSLLRSLKGEVARLYAIGDCLSPRRIIHAVLDGARTGVQL